MARKKFSLNMNHISVAVFFIFAFGFFGYYTFYSQGFGTGHAVLNIGNLYDSGGNLNGDFKISLKEGELLPANSLLSISVGEESYEYQLSDLINEPSTNGDYYLEGTSVSGSGDGYGKPGSKGGDEEVEFTLRIIKEKNNAESSFGSEGESSNNPSNSESPQVVEESGSPEETVSEEETQDESNQAVLEEEELEKDTEDIINSENNNENTDNGNSNSAGNEESENSGSNNEESSSADSSDSSESESSESAPITGNVASEIENKGNKVSGKVSKGNPFTYDLEEGESAELESSTQPVSVSVKDGEVIVTTDYSGEGQEGFGEEYLGSDDYELNIDISKLGISTSGQEVRVSLLVDGEEIYSDSKTIGSSEEQEVEEESNETEETNEEELVNETISNITETNQTIENKTVILEEEYLLTEEEIEKLKSITGTESVKVTKSEIVNERVIIRLELGNYWVERSYASSRSDSEIKKEIELDMAKWLKSLARSLIESENLEKESADQFVSNYSLS